MNSKYWFNRAKNYDNLGWVHNFDLLTKFISFCDLQSSDVVMDGGTGTGAVANKIVDKVKLVIATDRYKEMLNKGKFDKRIVTHEFNLEGEHDLPQFRFDKIICRMVFHHIHNLPKAFSKCYNLLVPDGQLIIQQAICPSTELVVTNWHRNVLKKAKKIQILNTNNLMKYLSQAKFKDLSTLYLIDNKFSINNWLNNSGLPTNITKELYNLHLHAPEEVKKAYDMSIKNGNININVTFVAIKGKK